MNVDKANEIGSQILESMIGKSILGYTLRRKQEAFTMNDKTCKFNEDVKVDSQLLFQRLLVVGERCDELSLVLKHELCNYPPALFEEPGVMRLANKSLLADARWNLLGDHPQDPPKCGEVQYVIDGGSLMHRITWHRGSTYIDICIQYITGPSCCPLSQPQDLLSDSTVERIRENFENHGLRLDCQRQLPYSEDD